MELRRIIHSVMESGPSEAALKVLSVKTEVVTSQLRRRPAAERIVKGDIDQVYLDRLKKGVRYWDGAEFRSEPTRVRHLPGY